MRKNILIAVLCVLLGIAVLNTIEGWFTLSPNEKIVREAKKNIVNDTIVYEKVITKDSIVHIRFEDEKNQLIQNKISENYLSYVNDTLAPALKVATEKITELTRVKAKLEGELKAINIEYDAEKKARAFYQNKYLTIVTNEADSTLAYQYNAVIDIAQYSKRKWFLGKELQMIDISSPDKNFKINGVERFSKEIYVHPKKFGIGFQMGYYFLPSEGKFIPAIGFGLSYNLLRF